MPIIDSDYKPPFYLRNPFIQSGFAKSARKLPIYELRRERIDTPDSDFIDLDWSSTGSTKLVLIIPGLESNSLSPWIMGMIHASQTRGWDAVVMNLRSCSGELNRLFRSYHAGDSDDLEFVLKHIHSNYGYTSLVISGFSLGGNIALKYAGERKDEIDPRISAVTAISVPCNLASCCPYLSKPSKSSALFLA